MKKRFTRLAAFVAAMIPVALQGQTFQQAIPESVSEIRVEDRASLTVTEGLALTLTAEDNSQVATIRGNRMTIDGNAFVRITLPAGHSMAFVAEDRASLVFKGSFGMRDRFAVHTEDHASAQFRGTLDDTVHAASLTLQAEDWSRISSETVMSCSRFDFASSDFSKIDLACKADASQTGDGTVHVEDQSSIDFNLCDSGSVTPYRHGIPLGEQEEGSGKGNGSFWQRRDVALDFAWGFHNWGSSMFEGFSGVDGAADVRTSFNHIHLSVNYPLLGTRHTGLYLGIGLDWDKYKFNVPEVMFDPSAAAFAEGTDEQCSSRMLTRYVVLPVSLRIDLWHDWQLTLAALPGLHWSGSHTGIHQEYDSDSRSELHKDQSVNRFVNPYKLDLRATLTCNGFGLYFQTATMSTMKSSVQELYPVKFGIIISID
ncbi:MAG: hypothetical protein J6I49_09690 [Bacteroidales bacterium]|nr:hypothetical protein [Bacteroidales bacterium]